MMHSLPVALTIAGSDCSAGAGIQADLKTFQHFQVHGLTAVTCVVSKTTPRTTPRLAAATTPKTRFRISQLNSLMVIPVLPADFVRTEQMPVRSENHFNPR